MRRDNSFAVVAVRCNKEGSTGQRKLKAGTIYYLLNGYDVKNPLHFHSGKRDGIDRIYDEYIGENEAGCNTHIQISAIVGKNGSGKSSLVEYVIRLLNNVAARLFPPEEKEDYVYEDEFKLNYIDGMDGSLWYVCDNQLYELLVKDDKVYLINKSEEHENCVSPIDIEPLASHRYLKQDLYRFFYTVVSNYSLYAYNSRDFKKSDYEKDYDGDCWIEGLFHKNDGYQAPIVLTPLREEGTIDINVENELAKERLISLLVRNESMRTLNGHLTVDGLIVSKNQKNNYDWEYVRKRLSIDSLNSESFTEIKELIKDEWGRKIEENLNDDYIKSSPDYKIAINYLAYKTLKIELTYKHTIDVNELSTCSTDRRKELIEKMMYAQIDDYSHITRKIYQTLSCLMYPIYRRHSENEDMENERYFFSDIWTPYEKTMRKERWIDRMEFGDQTAASLYQAALIPPPFLYSTINLHEADNDTREIKFETLSSGEKQQIFAIGSILYHIDNINSVRSDYTGDNEGLYPIRIPYQNVFLILEEVELYFHPEMQQQFIQYLLDGIRQLDIKYITGIHILIVTHSPYVLSDIPRLNVLALDLDGDISPKRLNTFCGNIHEMLKDSFFLSNGAQGYFAQWEIRSMLACMNIHKTYRSTHRKYSQDHLKNLKDWNDLVDLIAGNKKGGYEDAYVCTLPYIAETANSTRFNYEEFNQDYSEDLLRSRIEMIDEPLLRGILFRELEDAFLKSEDEKRLLEIESLKQRIRQLEKGKDNRNV